MKATHTLKNELRWAGHVLPAGTPVKQLDEPRGLGYFLVQAADVDGRKFTYAVKHDDLVPIDAPKYQTGDNRIMAFGQRVEIASRFRNESGDWAYDVIVTDFEDECENRATLYGVPEWSLHDMS